MNIPCQQMSVQESDAIFFDYKTKEDIARAKALCATCDSIAMCLEIGKSETKFGIFGGLLPNER